MIHPPHPHPFLRKSSANAAAEVKAYLATEKVLLLLLLLLMVLLPLEAMTKAVAVVVGVEWLKRKASYNLT